jgi:hypothetical protein
MLLRKIIFLFSSMLFVLSLQSIAIAKTDTAYNICLQTMKRSQSEDNIRMSMCRRVGKTGKVDTITYKRIEPGGFV